MHVLVIIENQEWLSYGEMLCVNDTKKRIGSKKLCFAASVEGEEVRCKRVQHKQWG